MKNALLVFAIVVLAGAAMASLAQPRNARPTAAAAGEPERLKASEPDPLPAEPPPTTADIPTEIRAVEASFADLPEAVQKVFASRMPDLAIFRVEYENENSGFRVEWQQPESLDAALAAWNSLPEPWQLTGQQNASANGIEFTFDDGGNRLVLRFSGGAKALTTATALIFSRDFSE